MLDTNIFDRLDDDGETLGELADRRDLILLVTDVQERELSAVGDPARRERLLLIMRSLCKTLRAPADGGGGRHRNDGLIERAAAARCRLLVSDDLGLLAHASRAGAEAMDWAGFRDRVVWGRAAGGGTGKR